jgi:Tol biopolymer transport system component
MKKLLVVLMVVFAVAFAAMPAFAEKRAFTIADLYKIKSVTDPVYSPDGKKVAFAVTEYFLEEGKTNSDIFLMNADGTGLRRMTRDEAADYSPRWSPDGRSLLFVSTREGGAQAW